MKTLRRAAVGAALLAAAAGLAAIAGGFWMRGRIEACLPRLDGSAPLHGLAAPVRVGRDALGVPTVVGSNRLDVARATGWLHAQDRFFEMDLLRRRGAGELSGLLGSSAIALDRQARLHGFRALARQVLSRESPERRALLQAYAEGVNEGLGFVGGEPWEYTVLRSRPRPWLAEDTFLAGYAMALEFEDTQGVYARSVAAIFEVYGPRSVDFFAPESTPDDAPLDASACTAAAIPPASEIDLRDAGAGSPAAPSTADSGGDFWEGAGSNAFAVSGRFAGGPAMVENDMHLHLALPNTWYRMSLRWPGHEETGVTLPGAPALIAGSTGRIAWGFTASRADTADLVVVDPGASSELYHGPHGGDLVRFDLRAETVDVRGSEPVQVTIPWTVWGPIVGDGPGGRQYALHWTGDDPAATNLDILDLEDAPDAGAALAVAHHMGIPAQNFVVADSQGAIGWTIAGFLPKRVGFTGRTPVPWMYGDRRWDGYLPGAEVPTIVSPADGRLWSANNRMVGGGALRAVGDSGYDLPFRAGQIRDGLAALGGGGRTLGARDLLAIAMDNRAGLLERWRAILVSALRPEVAAAKPSRQALLQALQSWDGRAGADSAGYTVVREFRLAAARRILDPIFAPCVARCPEFAWTHLNYEQPLESILTSRPAHLLSPAYKTWDELLAAAADDVTAQLGRRGLEPRNAAWGRLNRAAIDHPFARMLPHWASSWLRAPEDPLAGDNNLPRLLAPAYGASERFVVSPGREAQGVFHMPGGESANPLSPFFLAGHEAWVRGDATPFLPGPQVHTIDLLPDPSGSR